MRPHIGLLALFVVALLLCFGVQATKNNNLNNNKFKSSAPKPALNLKLRPESLEKIRNLKFKGIGWDDLKSLTSKWNLPRFKPAARDSGNTPNPSINAQLNMSMIESLDNSVFITQFVNFILTGRYDGVSEIGDQFDNNTLDAILGLGVQLYISIVTLEDPVPEEAFGNKIDKFVRDC